jgi:hypothetical protein
VRQSQGSEDPEEARLHREIKRSYVAGMRWAGWAWAQGQLEKAAQIRSPDRVRGDRGLESFQELQEFLSTEVPEAAGHNAYAFACGVDDIISAAGPRPPNCGGPTA